MNLNKKNIIKILASILLSAALIYAHFQFSIKLKYVIISVLALWAMLCFSSGRLFAPVFLLYALCSLSDMHFYRVYGYPFKEIAEQLFNVTMDTNIHEIISYFKILSYAEISGLILSLVLFVLFFNSKPLLNKTLNKKICLVILVLSVIAGYPKVFIKELDKIKAKSENDIELMRLHDQFKWNPVVAENSPDNVIMLIGESHRYDYFSKYWQTYPQFPDLLYFSDMISQYGYTLKAMPQILSRKQLEEDTKLYQETSIFKLFEEAGYETHFISYLPRLWSGDDSINYIAIESKNYYVYGDIVHDTFIDDAEIIPILDKILNNGKKNFIAIKMIGVHYNFEDRYPDEYDIVKPSLKDSSYPTEEKYKQYFLNTYENAINYSISVIHRIFEEVQNSDKKGLIAFASDHAMNIFDNGKWNIANVKETFHIPFMIYGNKSYMENVDTNKWNNLKANLNSPLIENDILETLASLSNIKITDKRNRDLTSATPIKDNRKVMFSDKSIHIYEELK